MNWKKTVLICIAILLAAGGTVSAIFLTEPTAQRSSASKRTAMLVELAGVERGTFRPTIVAMGAVRAEQEIVLSPRVAGEILAIADSFTPGGFVEEGEVLLQIDPADYETTLQLRRSELRQAMSESEMEQGRQELARRDYEELEGTISDQYKTLVLREPQLDAARAVVAAAEASVRQAELDLERTQIRAPFPAHILSRDAHVGTQVSPGQALGQLVGTRSYWVEATVPVADLRWIEFPGESGSAGSTARIRNRAAWPEELFREGRVHRLIGALETQTRMARVLLTVADPLAHEPESAGLPPLMVGSYVEVRIEGRPIEDVVRLDRDYLRRDDTVWVSEDQLLRIREAEVLFRDREYAYIRAGLQPGDRVVTTNLATVLDGAPLRVDGAAGDAE